MKTFDHDGLILAEYQGKIFEKSTELKCSTAVFLRRFLHSDFLEKMDTNDVTALSLDVNEGIDNIQNQFGESDMERISILKAQCFGWAICIDIFLIQGGLQRSF